MGNNDFNEFWQHVWLKVGKGAARRKFKIARKLATQEELVEGAKNYANWLDHEKTARQYWLHPATWLHTECWGDEIVFSKPPEREKTPIWGDSRFDPEAAKKDGEVEAQLIADAIGWLEEQDERDVEAAFVCVKERRGMSDMSIFKGSTWRQWPVWTAEEMGRQE